MSRAGARKLGTVERAFELARSSDFQGVGDIAQRLSAEGYEQVAEHLAGPLIRKQLRTACLVARPADGHSVSAR